MSYLELDEINRMKEYKYIASVNGTQSGTELGFFDMNTKVADYDSYMKKIKIDSKKEYIKQRSDRKSKLEKSWVKQTSQKAKDIKEKVGDNDPSATAYYSPFTLKEMEVLLKNNDRGGNSEKYNNVATDLELYNCVENAIDDAEKVSLLERLVQSCMKYMGSSFKGIRRQGKIRKAMINSICIKATQKSGEIKKYWEEQKTLLLENANEVYEDVIEKENISRLNESASKHHEIVMKYNLGFFKLSDEERKTIDQHFAKILQTVNSQKVREGQNDVGVTRFFNAIGWSDNKPRLVDNKEIERGGEEIKKSPIGSQMHHSINKLPGMDNAIPFAQQLAGTRKDGVNSHYYSDGMAGKGTYFTTKNVKYTLLSNGKDKEEEDYSPEESWTYGNKTGGVQVTACLNEYAKILVFDGSKSSRFESKLKKQFPLLYEKLPGMTINDRESNGAVTVYFSFWGYNVGIWKDVPMCKSSNVVVTDRKAISIAKEAVLISGQKFNLETGEIINNKQEDSESW